MKESDQNKFMSDKNKKVCTTLNYIEHFLTSIFAVTASFVAFASAENYEFKNRIKYFCKNCKN